MTITVKTPKGTEVKVSYEYRERVVDDALNADGDIICVRKKVVKNSDLKFIVGNKTYTVNELSISDYMTGQTAEKCRELNVNKCYRSEYEYEKKGRVVFIFDQDNVNSIDKLIKQTIENNKNEEVTKIETAQNEEKKQKQKKYAQEIIEKSKKTIKNSDGSLMNNSQARAYRIRWNNLYNEGGEGYIPEIITLEMFEKAQEIMKS